MFFSTHCRVHFLFSQTHSSVYTYHIYQLIYSAQTQSYLNPLPFPFTSSHITWSWLNLKLAPTCNCPNTFPITPWVWGFNLSGGRTPLVKLFVLRILHHGKVSQVFDVARACSKLWIWLSTAPRVYLTQPATCRKQSDIDIDLQDLNSDLLIEFLLID